MSDATADTICSLGDEYDQTIDDAAKFFGVHIRTAQRWVNEGRLLGVRTPGSTERRSCWRFQRSEFHRFAKANSNREPAAG